MTQLPLDDVLSCLERSGYLLESRIVRSLDAAGFFVEPNQVLKDPDTGKSREIDFVAEFYDGARLEGVYVNTKFVGEVSNNLYPFVLMTNRPSTPNERWESHVQYAVTGPDGDDIATYIDIHFRRSPPRERLFSQYCVLTRKKDNSRELMAHHPDDTYSSLQKLARYVESCRMTWESEEADQSYRRIFFWHPMVVLGGSLVVAVPRADGSMHLSEENSAFLEFNWHLGDEPKTTVIEVVTVSSLLDRMGALVQDDLELQRQLVEKIRDVQEK